MTNSLEIETQVCALFADRQAIIDELDAFIAMQPPGIPVRLPESLVNELINNGEATRKLREQINGPLS